MFKFDWKLFGSGSTCDCLFRPGRSDAVTTPPRLTSPCHPVSVVLAGKLAALPLWSLRRRRSPLGSPTAHRSWPPCLRWAPPPLLVWRCPPPLTSFLLRSTQKPAEVAGHHWNRRSRRIRVTAAHPLCAPCTQVTRAMTSHHWERWVRCLRCLEVIGENLPLASRHRLTVHVLESRRHAEGHRRPRSSAGATRASVARGWTPCVSAPSALTVVWAVTQPGHAGYYASRPLWAVRRWR
jgi:hypothetical protein